MNYIYQHQFPDANNEVNTNYENQRFNNQYKRRYPYNNQYNSGNYREQSYDRNAFSPTSQRYSNERIERDGSSEISQYRPRVNEPSSPFGRNGHYDRTFEQGSADSRQSRWHTLSRERDSGSPLNPSPLQNQAYEGMPGQTLRNISSYSQKDENTPFTRQTEETWQQPDTKSIKSWQSGTRPFFQNPNESWSPQRKTPYNYNQNSLGPQYDQSGTYYGIGSQTEDCVHLTDPSQAEHKGFERN